MEYADEITRDEGNKTLPHTNDSDEIARNEEDNEEEEDETLPVLIRVNKSNTMTLADWFQIIKPELTNMSHKNKQVFNTLAAWHNFII